MMYSCKPEFHSSFEVLLPEGQFQLPGPPGSGAQWASRHLQSSVVCLFSPRLGLGGKRNGKEGEEGGPWPLAVPL